MFFARPGDYEACGIFSVSHFVLLLITSIIIVILLYKVRNYKHEKVLKIIKISTIVLWILEILKIIFNICIGNTLNPNTYIPLYYCSLVLYAGIFSGFCKGKLKRVGDVFLATGGIVAGIAFLISPITSLGTYPIFHFISIQSFILHGTMIYLGMLMLITNYIELNLNDFKYYFILIIVISALAYIINSIYNSNLMFISQNYEGTIVDYIYNFTGEFFTITMIMIQAIIPFFAIYLLYNQYNKKH